MGAQFFHSFSFPLLFTYIIYILPIHVSFFMMHESSEVYCVELENFFDHSRINPADYAIGKI